MRTRSVWILNGSEIPNPLEIKGTPTVPCFVALQALNCGAGPSAKQTSNLQRKTWLSHVATPQSFTSKVMYNSMCISTPSTTKNSQVFNSLIHSHESQPLKGNVTSSSAMEDDLNHRNSTGFQIFFQGSQHLPLVEDVESLSPTSTRACFVDKNMNVVTLYCTKNIYVSYNHVFFCNYI